MYKSKEKLDIEQYLLKGMSEKEVEEYELTFDVVELYEGVSWDIVPGYVHRVVAITDLETIEASTTELDDVIRLQDDKNRKHGKIEDEHQ